MGESFLTKLEDDDDDEEEEEEEILPIKHQSTLRKVQDSLDMDKELDLKETGILDSVSNEENAYKMANDIALQTHKTLRLMKRETFRDLNEKEGEHENNKKVILIKHRATLRKVQARADEEVDVEETGTLDSVPTEI